MGIATPVAAAQISSSLSTGNLFQAPIIAFLYPWKDVLVNATVLLLHPLLRFTSHSIFAT